MHKLIVASVAAATLLTWSASANASTYFRAKPHATYHVRVNPITLARLKIATARLALASYQLRYTMSHRHVHTPSRVRLARSPLLSRRSG
jgi:hypothetical protein